MLCLFSRFNHMCVSLSLPALLLLQMGVAETHQVLTRNELRERVVLRADGGFRSGRDILVAAALGADEYGFGTVAMIATGCIMARVCHTNNCPVGVASQREELRARFPGAPADLVNFFHFVAEEVRGEEGEGRVLFVVAATPAWLQLVESSHPQHLDSPRTCMARFNPKSSGKATALGNK